MKKLIGFGIATGLAALLATGASAETRITYKSAKSGSSYYQMGVEIAEALKKKTDGDIVVTVEESQGSVQNVMEVRARGADYVFTTPPALVSAAQKAAGPFDGKGDPKFEDIRALFPIPSLTMHFVMSDEERRDRLRRASKARRSCSARAPSAPREGEKYLSGCSGSRARSTIVGRRALERGRLRCKNGQIDGFVTAGSWPAPNVIEAAASTRASTVLSLTDEQVAETKRAKLVIPAGTYAGQDSGHRHDLAAGGRLHDDRQMSDDAAYALTKDLLGIRRARWARVRGHGGTASTRA